MSSLHELQVLVTRSVDVAQNVQAVSHSFDATKNLLLIKQAAEYSENLRKKVKTKDKTEKKNIQNENDENLFPQKREVTVSNKNTSNLRIDEYRGKILDLRLWIKKHEIIDLKLKSL